MKNLRLRLCSSTIGSLFLFLLVPYLLLFWLEYKTGYKGMSREDF